MSEQRLVSCGFCGQEFSTTQMEDPAPGSTWICGQCEQLSHFERSLLRAVSRIGSELFALVEAKGEKDV